MKYLFLFILVSVFSFSVLAQDNTNNSKPDKFIFVQQMPEYVGGDAARLSFINQNLHYPKVARDSGIEGKVVVEFLVNEDGSLSDVRALSFLGGGCTDEAIRVVKAMPKWKPALQNNKPVKVYFNLPIVFKLN